MTVAAFAGLADGGAAPSVGNGRSVDLRDPGPGGDGARNRTWSWARTAQEPGYFARLATRHNPVFFWIGGSEDRRIGGSDSRAPANVIAGLDPGEVFVHRNVANVIHRADMNFLPALEFAVDTLRIREIIVCGHDGCGGVRAATEDMAHGLADPTDGLALLPADVRLIAEGAWIEFLPFPRR